MNPKIETVDYLWYGKKNTIIVIADDKLKVMVLKEHSIQGPSLTNSIEAAIVASFKAIIGYRFMPKDAKDWKVLQDCGDEGIFKVSFDVLPKTDMLLDVKGDSTFSRETVANVKWEYFSDDLKVLELLYAKT